MPISETELEHRLRSAAAFGESAPWTLTSADVMADGAAKPTRPARHPVLRRPFVLARIGAALFACAVVAGVALVVVDRSGLPAHVGTSPSLRYGQGVLRKVTCTGSGTSRSCGGLITALPGLSDRIELGSTVALPGHVIKATLVVTNTSGYVVHLNERGCASRFGLALTDENVAPQILFFDVCVAPSVPGSTINPGVNRFAFSIPTRFGGCQMQNGRPCTARPLPTGQYFVVLIGDGRVALPPAVAGPVSLRSAPAVPLGQIVKRIVTQKEQDYFLDPSGPGTKMASYVVTSPSRAFAFLNNVDFGNVYFSSSSKGAADGTPSVELRLILDERGQVALVELTGGSQLNGSIPMVGGVVCPASKHQTCTPPEQTYYRADVAFLVISLNSHQLVGGMLASPGGTTPNLALSPLGQVTSFVAPDHFGAKPKGPYKVQEVNMPHQTSQ